MYTECDQWPWHNWRCETGSFGVWSSTTALLVTDNYSITRSQNSVYTRRHFWTIKRIAYSSSRMRVMNYNWSATKRRLHLQSVTEISHHSVLSGDRIRQCGTSSGSRHKNIAISFCRYRSVPVPCENGSAETTVAEGGWNPPVGWTNIACFYSVCKQDQCARQCHKLLFRKTAPVFRFCWNPFSMKVVRVATWSQVLRPFWKPAWSGLSKPSTVG